MRPFLNPNSCLLVVGDRMVVVYFSKIVDARTEDTWFFAASNAAVSFNSSIVSKLFVGRRTNSILGAPFYMIIGDHGLTTDGFYPQPAISDDIFADLSKTADSYPHSYPTSAYFIVEHSGFEVFP